MTDETRAAHLLQQSIDRGVERFERENGCKPIAVVIHPSVVGAHAIVGVTVVLDPDQDVGIITIR